MAQSGLDLEIVERRVLPVSEREIQDAIVWAQDPAPGSMVSIPSTVRVWIYADPPPDDSSGRVIHGTWESFGLEHGLPSLCVTAIDIAVDGAVWVGCSRGIAVRPAGQTTWRTFSGEADIIDIMAAGEDAAWALQFASEGVRTVSKYGSGGTEGHCPVDDSAAPRAVCHFDDGSWRILSASSEELAVTTDGALWRSGEETGLERYADGTWTLHSRPFWMSPDDAPGIPAVGTELLWSGPDGSLWARVDEGLARYDGRTWEHHRVDPRVTDLAFTTDGRLWVSTQGGAYYFDGSTWFEVAGYPVGDSIEFTGVAVAPDGSIWFATSQSGLLRYVVR